MKTLMRSISTSGSTSRRAAKGAALILTLVTLGCVRDATEISSPSKNGVYVGRNSVGQNGKVDGFVVCDVGVRITTMLFRIRQESIRLPMSVPDSTETVKFMFFAWHDQTGPARLASCQVPNTPQSLAFVNATFAQGNVSTNEFKRLHYHQAGAADKTQYLDVKDGGCAQGPVDFGCACSSNPCAGWTLVQATTKATTPDVTQQSHSLSPSVQTVAGTPAFEVDTTYDQDGIVISGDTADISADLSAPDDPPGSFRCDGQTDWPHQSYHYPNTINVEGWTNCHGHAMPILSVFVSLEVEFCLSDQCWWQIWAVSGLLPKTEIQESYVEANAWTDCMDGLWRGVTNHFAVAPPNYTPLMFRIYTIGAPRRITCTYPE